VRPIESFPLQIRRASVSIDRPGAEILKAMSYFFREDRCRDLIEEIIGGAISSMGCGCFFQIGCLEY